MALIVSVERPDGRRRVSEDQATSDGSASGPICPHCLRPLRGNLRQEEVMPQEANGPGPKLAMAVTYCGSCGWTLDVAPARTGFAGRRGPMAFEEVAAPADGQTLEGQFQLRCRELVGEARSLGFDPDVWVGMINDLGAAGAARKLLADHHELAVTPWLVNRGRPELTLEYAIGQPTWAELFTDAERAEAARRLANPRMGPRKRRGWLRRRGWLGRRRPSSARRP
jgi:hypothetical protein